MNLLNFRVGTRFRPTRIINARLPYIRAHFVNRFPAYFTFSRLCEWQFKMRTDLKH